MEWIRAYHIIAGGNFNFILLLSFAELKAKYIMNKAVGVHGLTSQNVSKPTRCSIEAIPRNNFKITVKPFAAQVNFMGFTFPVDH